MIIVCGTETSALQYADPRMLHSLAMFRLMQMGWVQRTREQGPGSTATVQDDQIRSFAR